MFNIRRSPSYFWPLAGVIKLPTLTGALQVKKKQRAPKIVAPPQKAKQLDSISYQLDKYFFIPF